MRKGRLFVTEDGHKKEIGEIVVDASDGEYIDFTGHITDPDYQDILRVEEGSFSIVPDTLDATYTPPAVRKQEAPTFKGRVPRRT